MSPYADFLIAYQYAAYLRGPFLGVILLLGGVAAVRRPGVALLPWRRACWSARSRCSTSTTGTCCRSSPSPAWPPALVQAPGVRTGPRRA
ncbi:hypothetical protein [Nonomuraea roseoviolacea]|uniref:Uncharacterized protein n=1 Tax=Nonomuraea roseoviolacea subsp. carminata TaxID=160689 RepID=A0ABT1K3N5_9ACTN|nr:hypothetical protein [Nonomuraea roseoviolacea]MCP2348096.1 hypothetical protein [Nonomuraea roseoviolacea subsp. carminata]